MVTLESTAAETLVEVPAPVGPRPAVEVAHLRKAYGSLAAVDDVSFTVTEGEIFGILGPNGAGKTTAIECATGSGGGTSNGYFCDPALDRTMRLASQPGLTDPARSAAAWAAIDHRLTDAAVWVPTVSLRVVDLTSRRLGNYQYDPVWGFVADRSWVR